MHRLASLYGCIEQWNKHKFVAALSVSKALNLKKIIKINMMIFLHVRLNHFHAYIVAKSVNSSNAFLTSKVNIVIYYVAILLSPRSSTLLCHILLASPAYIVETKVCL